MNAQMGELRGGNFDIKNEHVDTKHKLSSDQLCFPGDPWFLVRGSAER